MNRVALKKNPHARIRLRPTARRFVGQTELERSDTWIITDVGKGGVAIRNPRTDHGTTLGYDHIHHYVADPARTEDGLSYGFLILNVQTHLGGTRVWIEPPPPGVAIS